MARRRWSPEDVNAALREAQRSGQPMRSSELARRDGSLFWAMLKHYGSYAAAMAAAGIAVGPRRESWSAERVIEEIQRMHREGRSLAFVELQRSFPKLLAAASWYHGNYRKALAAAGIDPDPVLAQRRHTRESIVQYLRRRQSEGKSMRPVDIKDDDVSLAEACQRLYGSCREALQAAGLDVEGVCNNRWSKEKIIAELRRAHGEGKLHPAESRSVKSLISSSRSYFGSYRDALRAAGIDSDEVVGAREEWDREKVLETLREHHAAGHRMTGLRRIDGKLAVAARKYFGTYRKALEEAGIEAESYESWTCDAVLAELRRRHGMGELRESKDGGHVVVKAAARRCFGSLRQALEAAGIDPQTVVKQREMKQQKAAEAEYDAMVKRAIAAQADDGVVEETGETEEPPGPAPGPAWNPGPAIKSGKWRAELYFGPYNSPRVRRGQRIFCERFGTVKVVRFSDGPIPWPMGLPPGRWGKASLVLCGDLVRAVRMEASVAVARAWGVSESTVLVWRRLLGVERVTPGYHHFATTVGWGGLTEEVRAQARALQTPQLRAEAMARAREGRTPYKRPWTAEEDGLLGVMPDMQLAKRLGCDTDHVRERRRELKLAPWRLSPEGLKAKMEANLKGLLRYSGEKMKARRLALGLYQKQVAERGGWADQSTYWTMESGNRKYATRGVLERVAKALECKVEDLLE